MTAERKATVSPNAITLPIKGAGNIRMRVSPMSDPIIARRSLERAVRARAIVEDELVVEIHLNRQG